MTETETIPAEDAISRAARILRNMDPGQMQAVVASLSAPTFSPAFAPRVVALISPLFNLPYPVPGMDPEEVAILRIRSLVTRVSMLEGLLKATEEERDAAKARKIGRLPFRIPDSQPAPMRVVVAFESTGKGRTMLALECGHRYERKREPVGGLRECRKCARGKPSDEPRPQVEPAKVGGVL